MDFGFCTMGMTFAHLLSSGNLSHSSPSTSPSTFQAELLPEKGCPTIMKPCLTTIMSYICTTLSQK